MKNPMCSIMKVVAVIAVCSVCSISQASVITLQADFSFSGPTPAGTAPWLTATFDDYDTPGSVTMTLSNTNLASGEFTSDWYLNIDPALNVSSLIFSELSKVGSFDSPTISKGEDGFKADGDGFYDIKLAFSTSGKDGGSHRFVGGQSVSYVITGISTLTSNSFSFGSTTGGGTGTYAMAAHVQGISSAEGTTSSWVAPGLDTPYVPEPTTMVLLALGGGLALLRRRRRLG